MCGDLSPTEAGGLTPEPRNKKSYKRDRGERGAEREKT